MDWMEQEQERGITITSAATACEWDGPSDQHPRHARATSTSPSRSSARCASSTGRSRSSTRWPASSPSPRPCGARPTSTASRESPTSTRWTAPAPTSSGPSRRCGSASAPIRCRSSCRSGRRTGFEGVVDLIENKALVWTDELGTEFAYQEIPTELADRAHDARTHLIEACADYDDELMEAYLNDEEIPHERIAKSLHRATLDIKVTPVLCGSSFKNKGVQPLLDAIVELLPSPLEVPPVVGHRAAPQGRGRRGTRGRAACRRGARRSPRSPSR